MIKNIILDIGGVIFDDSDLNLSKILNLSLEETKKIVKIAFGGNFKKCLLGELTIDEHLLDLKKQNVDNYEVIEYILSFDNLKYSFPVMNDTIEVINMLKTSNYKIYLLSNITKESYKYISETIVVSKSFDGGIFSYVEHIAKPNKEIYERLINKYNLNKKETIFFDDKEKNVAAAKEIGLKSIKFNNIVDIYDNLDFY